MREEEKGHERGGLDQLVDLLDKETQCFARGVTVLVQRRQDRDNLQRKLF
jgi:hypothetical protein